MVVMMTMNKAYLQNTNQYQGDWADAYLWSAETSEVPQVDGSFKRSVAHVA